MGKLFVYEELVRIIKRLLLSRIKRHENLFDEIDKPPMDLIGKNVVQH